MCDHTSMVVAFRPCDDGERAGRGQLMTRLEWHAVYEESVTLAVVHLSMPVEMKPTLFAGISHFMVSAETEFCLT